MANNKDQDDLQDGSVDQGDEEFYDDQDDAGHEGDLGEDSGDENWEEDESPASSAKGEGKKKVLSLDNGHYCWRSCGWSRDLVPPVWRKWGPNTAT
jgi:hypothetical protein